MENFLEITQLPLLLGFISFLFELVGCVVGQDEENMDQRPKRHVWNGVDYESDHDEDEKPEPGFF